MAEKDVSNVRYLLLPDDITKNNITYAAVKRKINITHFKMMELADFATFLLKHSGKGTYRLQEADIVNLLLRRILSSDVDPELQFFKQLDLTNRDTLKVLQAEFDEYLRATNDTEFHVEALKVAEGIKDDFARTVALSCLAAFLAIRNKLEALAMEQFEPRILSTRAQLLRLATTAVESTENKMLFDGWKIALAGIPVLDAAVLRLLVVIGTLENCELRIFCTPTLHESLKKRLDGAKIPYEDLLGKTPSPKLCADAEALLGINESGKPKFFAAPDRRREVLELAENISEMLDRGTHPSDILVIARDSGAYQPLATNIFPAFGIPFHVQTRQLTSLLPQTQMVSSLLKLLSACSSNATLDWNVITDPIRLGFCLPQVEGWPMQGIGFVYLEEELAGIQKEKGKQLSLDDWIAVVDTSGLISEPKEMLLGFLKWVKSSSESPGSIPTGIASLREILEAYLRAQSIWARETIDYRVEIPGRFRLAELHPTQHADRLRKQLQSLEKYLEHDERIGGFTQLSWSIILDAYQSVILGSSYGIQYQDLGAIRFIDAGLSSFVEAKHLFILGMQAEEFPRKHTEGKLLPEGFRKAIANAQGLKASYLFLSSPSTDYDTDRDYLYASLMTTSDSVTCSMSYLDESGHSVEWSPFVSNLTESNEQIPPDKWLPTLRNNWVGQISKNPPWVRWRLFSYHQYRKALPSTPDVVGSAELAELANRIDHDFHTHFLQNRIDRYVAPSTTIEVKASEEWFSGLSLEAIAGPPFRTHELDVHATCPFQFYFLQFLYLRNFDKIDRDSITDYSWTLPWVPHRISEFYPGQKTERALCEAIGSLKNRQEQLRNLSASKTLWTFLSQHMNQYDAKRLLSTLVAESSLARQEESEGLARDWDWIQGGKEVSIDGQNGSIRIIIPAHRLDRLKGSQLVVAYAKSSRQLQSIIYQNDLGRNRTVIAKQVGDPLLDYRLPILMVYHAGDKLPLAGGLFIGLYGDVRRGYYSNDMISEHKGKLPYKEELPMPLPANIPSLLQTFDDKAWDRRLTEFREAIVQRGLLMSPGGTITYEARPSFELCTECVYYSLCHIPRSHGW